MAPDIFKQLLLRRQNQHLMKQTQGYIVVKTPRVLQESPKDVQMGFMALTPSLERAQVIKVSQPKRPILVRLERSGIDNIHQPTTVTSNLLALITEEIHALCQNRMHRLDIQFPFLGTGIRPILAGADDSKIVLSRDTNATLRFVACLIFGEVGRLSDEAISLSYGQSVSHAAKVGVFFHRPAH